MILNPGGKRLSSEQRMGYTFTITYLRTTGLVKIWNHSTPQPPVKQKISLSPMPQLPGPVSVGFSLLHPLPGLILICTAVERCISSNSTEKKSLKWIWPGQVSILNSSVKCFFHNSHMNMQGIMRLSQTPGRKTQHVWVTERGES